MMDKVLAEVKARLETIPDLKYISEDWGQLDYYGERPPVNFPCVLYDVAGAEYSDRSQRSQDGQGQVLVRVAYYKPVNVSSRTTRPSYSFDMAGLLERVFVVLQGASGETFTGLSRFRLSKVRRDDGIREFEIYFAFGFVDNAAVKKAVKVTASPQIEVR